MRLVDLTGRKAFWPLWRRERLAEGGDVIEGRRTSFILVVEKLLKSSKQLSDKI